MRLISLNVWGGRLFAPLASFFRRYGPVTDIFCLQEMFSTSSDINVSHGIRANCFSEVQEILHDFRGYFAPVVRNVDFHGRVYFDLWYGLAIFVRRDIHEKRHGSFFVHGSQNAEISSLSQRAVTPRNVQFLELERHGTALTVANIHGIWQPSRGDSPETLRQCEAVRKFLDESEGKRILSGDLNLDLDTESLALLEAGGFSNLVKKEHVISTRSLLASRPISHADYIFVSPEVEVRAFQVLPDQVSDHMALSLEFD